MQLLATFWTLYFTLHSVLATSWAKQAVEKRWLQAFRFYRLAYNQLSVWGFLLIFRYQLNLPEHWLFQPPQLLVGGSYVLLGLGLLVAVAALRGYDLGEFLGWAYVRRKLTPAATTLSTSGMNGVVRHPLYLGLLLGLTGYFLMAPTTARAIFVGCNLLYLLVGSRLEERKLLLQFGEAYARYQLQVPRLLPWRKAVLTPGAPGLADRSAKE
jgi:protein-S-isoprenylcysteine O-methyltransferase Ste14